MSFPEVTSREQWEQARVALLTREKELTRARDALNADRRRLPMVALEKEYVFDGPAGATPLAELFGDSRQLIIRHVMFDPDWDGACPGCTACVDGLSEGTLAHLRSRDTAFALVSRAPLDKIETYRASKGWTVPWYSSFGTDFNYDFHVSLDASVAPVQYNYRDAGQLTATGAGWVLDEPQELAGVSSFLRQDGVIYHTYSTYGRGDEGLSDAYFLLDITALGRQEDWEEPKGRAPAAHPADPSFTSSASPAG
jgi:predicted dithiol-disulfide oxidoreductase (DUF899 family)